VKIDAGVIHLIPPIVVNVITNINCFLLIGNIKPLKPNAVVVLGEVVKSWVRVFERIISYSIVK
jgi:hypothetical protein